MKKLPKMYQQVISQIIEYIEHKNLSEGDRIPTERELSEMLNVSRASVREAIRSLELLGYLISKQGEGTYIANPPAFIIPVQSFEHRVPDKTLNYYFEVFKMCIEKVSLILQLKQVEPPEENNNLHFWSSCFNWIQDYKIEIENEELLSLLTQLYQLLMENGYFVNKSTPLLTDFNSFYSLGSYELINFFKQQC
ncbi:hypothetical protein MTP04_29240 [Lysinibacillus sp. PLM2]|nr:hypothetical protein MTP04_29240 [Lysinibacillus sp. PLM2]